MEQEQTEQALTEQEKTEEERQQGITQDEWSDEEKLRNSSMERPVADDGFESPDV